MKNFQLTAFFLFEIKKVLQFKLIFKFEIRNKFNFSCLTFNIISFKCIIQIRFILNKNKIGSMNLNKMFQPHDHPLALVSKNKRKLKSNKENKISNLCPKERNNSKLQNAVHQGKPSIHIRKIKSLSNIALRQSQDKKDVKRQSFLKMYYDRKEPRIKIPCMRSASNIEKSQCKLTLTQQLEFDRQRYQRTLDKDKYYGQLFLKDKPLLTLNSKPSNSSTQKTQELPNIIQPCQMLTLELVSKLKLQKVICISENGNYLIKKKDFQNVITALLKILSTEQTSPIFQEYREQSQILETMKKIYEISKSNKENERKLKLCLKSKIVKVEVNHQLLAYEEEHCQQRILTVSRESEIIKQTNKKNKDTLAQIKAQFNRKQAESAHLMKQLHEAQKDLKTLRSLQKSLRNQIFKLEQTRALEQEINLQLREILRKKYEQAPAEELQQNSKNLQM